MHAGFAVDGKVDSSTACGRWLGDAPPDASSQNCLLPQEVPTALVLATAIQVRRAEKQALS